MQAGDRFIKGALVLTLAGVVVKVLGAVYRIPLYNILGAEGIGLFQAVYPVYAMMLSVSTAGVPVAVSKLVAEKIAHANYKGAQQVFRVALGLMIGSGMVVTGVLLLSARFYTERVLMAPGAFYPLIAISPSIIFFAVKSSFRGYFQGQQSMVPTAMSQIVEQVVRVATIFLLASVLVRRSLEMGAAGAAFGTVTGALMALGFLVIVYLRQRPRFLQMGSRGNNSLSSTKKVMTEIIALALPITIGSIVLPLVNMVDATLILPRLQAGGFSEAQALEMFGNFTGAAMPLVNMPTIFTLALATSLVPAIANANAHRNRNLIKKLSSLATRIGLMIGLPAATGLFLLSEPISLMLYDNVDVARPLALAAFAIVFISLNQTTAPVLQGMGKTYLPVAHMFIGLVFKVLINYFLTAIPAINILGPVAGTILGFAVAGYLNLRSISRQIGPGTPVLNSFIKPTINAAIMGAVVHFSYPVVLRHMANVIASERLLISGAVLITMAMGVVIYGLATLFTGTITRAELELVPKIGPKVAKILARFGLLRR
jgi:stage V sporulation protein B